MSRRAGARERPLARVGVALAAYKPNLVLFRRQLESIRSQDYAEWFCVVTMDSPLPSVEDAPWFAAFIADPRFVISANDERLGLIGNFQKATRIALQMGAEAISFSDQDDVWYPNKISRSLGYLNSQPVNSAVFVDARVILNGTVQPHTRSFYTPPFPLNRRFLLSLWSAWGNGIMCDAELIAIHGMPSHLIHDSWVSLAASFHGGVNFYPEVLFEYVLHNENIFGIEQIQKAVSVADLPFKLWPSGSNPEKLQGIELARRNIESLGENKSRLWSFVLRSPFGGVTALLLLIVEARIRGVSEKKIRVLERRFRHELLRSLPEPIKARLRSARDVIRRRSALRRRS